MTKARLQSGSKATGSKDVVSQAPERDRESGKSAKVRDDSRVSLRQMDRYELSILLRQVRVDRR